MLYNLIIFGIVLKIFVETKICHMEENARNKIVPWDDISQEIRQALIDVSLVADALPVWECRNLITEGDLRKITPLLEEYDSLFNEQGQDEYNDEVQRIIGKLELIFLNKGVTPIVSDDIASLQFRLPG